MAMLFDFMHPFVNAAGPIWLIVLPATHNAERPPARTLDLIVNFLEARLPRFGFLLGSVPPAERRCMIAIEVGRKRQDSLDEATVRPLREDL